MTIEATPARARAIAPWRDSEAVRAAVRIGLSSRMAVLLVAIFAALSFGPASGGLARENAAKFDDPVLTHAIADPVLAPLARWDSVWYLTIADSGYGGSTPGPPSSRSTRCWSGVWAPSSAARTRRF